MDRYSIVEKVEDHLNYHCGYCDSHSACSKGLWAHAMNAADYQALIDRGWRRSGKYCYKCIMDKACCPLYTIRCEILNYKPTKSKKKVIKKMKNFLMSDDDSDFIKWRDKHSERTAMVSSAVQGEPSGTMDSMDCNSSLKNSATAEPANLQECKKNFFKGLGPDPTKPKCRKAKVLRQERRKTKASPMESGDALGVSSNALSNSSEPNELGLPHLLLASDFKKKLEVRTVRASVTAPEFLKHKAESFAVYKKYQTTIHGDSPSQCTEKQWIRFLVDCPLNRDPSGPGQGYGNYHQHYVLDGKIIAVGVIDILPDCISSVYVYYDPDFGFLSLGVYTALSEIAFARTLHLESAQLQYYYMGFYVHGCQKMRYKKEYPPSYLLCPESYEWVPISLCLDALDKSKYSRLNVFNGGLASAVDTERGDRSDVDDILVLYRSSIMRYYQYAKWNYPEIAFPECSDEEGSCNRNKDKEIAQRLKMDDELSDLQDYVAGVGTKCASRMLLYREYVS